MKYLSQSFLLVSFLFSLSLFPQSQQTLVESTALLPESLAISAKIIKISEEDIENSQAKNLAEVLEAHANSSFVSQSGPNGTASLFMRGTNF